MTNSSQLQTVWNFSSLLPSGCAGCGSLAGSTNQVSVEAQIISPDQLLNCSNVQDNGSVGFYDSFQKVKNSLVSSSR